MDWREMLDPARDLVVIVAVFGRFRLRYVRFLLGFASGGGPNTASTLNRGGLCTL